ncbi:MAG: lactate utilization protein [Ruminococcaceae bacterium]|nr:lactate utilization protein [Oscillospiraceae bacterium]
MNEQIKITMEALKENNMVPFYAENKEEALEILKGLIKENDLIGLGGSMTLKEIGATALVRGGGYNIIDRYDENLTAEERMEYLRKALLSDVFLTSSNAISEKGELINVDGFGNRGAALVYGPKSVVVVVGKNKIVKNAEEGFKRIKEIAAPKNCQRLSKNNYCAFKNECMAISGDSLSSGCKSESRICCSYIVQSYQLIKDRIKVIICNEDLGY